MKWVVLVCAFLVLPSPSVATPEVRLGNTIVTGRYIPTFQQDFFGGIPFAESPVGEHRFQPPVFKPSLDVKKFDASAYGLVCIQPSALFNISDMSEDCLTINVLRPSGVTSASKLPVLFWTYGGGFIYGAAPTYNGSAIVAQSVARGTPLIFVNFNYRLGPLGFPQGKEAGQRHALNLGLKDQVAALKWVQHNIGLFGGDRNKVTAAGESAGSIMTSILFLDHHINGLARAAIFESAHANTFSLFHADIREIDWQNFVRNVPTCASLAKSGCTFDCLQGANSSEITLALFAAISEDPELFPWCPVLDGPGGIVPGYASVLFSKGRFSKLPFIAGTNLDEGTFFVAPPMPPPTSESFIAQNLIANFSPPVVSPQTLKSHVQKLLQLYPDNPALGSPFNTGNNTFGLGSLYKKWAAIFGDLHFESLRRFWSQAFSKAGVKTYGYHFTEPPFGEAPELGVLHSAELHFVFGNPAVLLTPSSKNLSTIIMDYWISFAVSLDPNDGHGTTRPLWQPYSTKRQALMQLHSNNLTMVPDNYRKEQIDFINSDPIVWLH